MSADVESDFAVPFPIEFVINETPRSFQSKNAPAKERWKQLVRTAAQARVDALREFVLLDDRPLAAKILYFPPAPMEGDVDNVVKLILDGLIGVVCLNDRAIERVVVQKIEPGVAVEFTSITEALERAADARPPAVYIRIDDELRWRTLV